MPIFLKGTLSQYQELLEGHDEYRESLFLEEEEHRLYEDGKPLDVRIEVEDVIDGDYLHKKSYRFIGPYGDVAVIEDAYIPSIEDNTLVIHDVSSGDESDYSNGLMSFRDKFVLDQLSKLLGIKLEYKYWATIHHYSDVLNKDYDKLTQVEVYKNEDDEWCYDYEDFRWKFYDQGTESVTLTVTVPAGTLKLTSEGVYPIPDTVYTDDGGVLHPTGDPIIIPGVDEIATVRAESIKFIRDQQDFNYYDGGSRPDDTSTLIPVGCMPVGTTVGELEQETVSEVISRILFTDASLVKVCDTSAYIKFTDEYKNTYGDDKYIRVGSRYPSVDDFETVFIPETWQAYAAGQPIGDPIYKTEYVSTDMFIDDGQHLGTDPHGDPDDPSTYSLTDPEYEEHLEMFTVGALPHWCDGQMDYMTWSTVDRSVYFGIINYRYVDTSVDASILSKNYLGFEDHHSTHPHYVNGDYDFTGSLICAWPILTNATDVSTQTVWPIRNEDPGEYIGDSSIKAWGLGVPNQELYLRWPAGTKVNEHFYVYLPEEYEIAECGGAHDGANDEWSANQYAEVDIDPSTGEPVIVPIDYKAFGLDTMVTHNFKRWIIKKAAVITNVRIRIVDGLDDENGD